MFSKEFSKNQAKLLKNHHRFVTGLFILMHFLISSLSLDIFNVRNHFINYRLCVCDCISEAQVKCVKCDDVQRGAEEHYQMNQRIACH